MHPALRLSDTPELENEDLVAPEHEGGFGAGGILLLVLIIGLGLGGWAYVAHHDGWLHDLDDGLEAAADSGKPILVFYTADWCPPCKQLKATALADPDVDDALAEKFVRVKIDLSKRTGPNVLIANQYGVDGIPTMILYDSHGNERERVTGGAQLADWLYAKTAG